MRQKKIRKAPREIHRGDDRAGRPQPDDRAGPAGGKKTKVSKLQIAMMLVLTLQKLPLIVEAAKFIAPSISLRFLLGYNFARLECVRRPPSGLSSRIKIGPASGTRTTPILLGGDHRIARLAEILFLQRHVTRCLSMAWMAWEWKSSGV